MPSLKRALLQRIGPHLLPSARVVGVHEPSERFRFIELEAEAFRSAKLGLGDKIQINVGDWEMRTYTPLSLDAETGRLGILAYVHGRGPGSAWAAKAKTGDECQFLGPRSALKRPELPFVLFGDETAIATIATMQGMLPRGTPAKFILETSHVVEANKIVRDLGLKDVQVVSKTGEGAATDAALTPLVLAATEMKNVILAGSAQSIRRARDHLREEEFPMARITTKAYWSEGRVGLD